ncbi:uncharacterized protein EV420DRAFT_1758649 [Desarmillaria tabescens]|uniref:Uncharacterized protein n=1 Tax=Armillaria tabescens TaxID=1929756 RepID=A0AA39TQ83_ARMTA|nr:uncharacterized protein EV420DRAFT_1758649 [Desarmillaria tabescens]KAK0466707.1 hypothetical protein EV420DRAFT_1758649 [Desarmillaria tabescens]
MILRISSLSLRTSLSPGYPVTFRRTFATPLSLRRDFRTCPDISTLNAANLSRNDLCDFSNMISVSTPEELSSPRQLRYLRVGATNLPFPKSCKGFLYYWTHPDLPVALGSIRFRIIPEGDPSLFSAGKDLLLPNGMPWSIPLHQLVVWKGNMLRLLLKDKLVDQSLISSEYIRVFVELRLKKDSTLLRSPEESFPISLPQDSLHLHLLSEDHQAQKVAFFFKPMVEFQELVKPGQQVYAHARLEVIRPKGNRLALGLRISNVLLRGVQVDREFPLIECKAVKGRSALQSWFPNIYEIPEN